MLGQLLREFGMQMPWTRPARPSAVCLADGFTPLESSDELLTQSLKAALAPWVYPDPPPADPQTRITGS